MLPVRRQKQGHSHILILTDPAFHAAGGIYLLNNFDPLLFTKIFNYLGDSPLGKRQARHHPGRQQ